jgi:hypothetical protein
MSFWVYLSIGVIKRYFLSPTKKVKIQPMTPKPFKLTMLLSRPLRGKARANPAAAGRIAAYRCR